MKKISILALENAPLIGMVGPMNVFLHADEHRHKINHGENDISSAQIELVSVDGKNIKCFDNLYLSTHRSINEVKSTDLIIIPSLGLDIVPALDAQKLWVPWIRQQYAKGTIIACFCSGAFLLAETGLLNGKIATTHWQLAARFKKTYPQVILKPERMIIDEGNIICAGTATAFLDLSIYLIEKYWGFSVSTYCSKSLLIDKDRVSQLPYSNTLFEEEKYERSDKKIKEVQQFIEENYMNTLSIEKIASTMGMSKRNLLRRFKTETKDTPMTYLQKVRIEKTKVALERSNQTIEEIMYQVGYNDSRSFRRLFKKYTDLTPGAYRKRFRNFFPPSLSTSEQAI